MIAPLEVLYSELHRLGLVWIKEGQVGDCVDYVETVALVLRLAELGDHEVDLARVLLVLEEIKFLRHRVPQDAITCIV